MPKILIIDDDQDLLVTMRLVLETHKFKVETATTPEEGIAKVESARPDPVSYTHLTLPTTPYV